MKKSLLKRILVLMMAVVLLLLCGCAAMEEGGAVLDEQLEAFSAMFSPMVCPVQVSAERSRSPIRFSSESTA